MDKTTQQLYDDIMASKDSEAALADLLPYADNSQQLLADLKTVSKTAEFRLWAYIVAFAKSTIAFNFRKHKDETNTNLENKEPGNIGWWKRVALEFQLGDILEWNVVRERYLYADTTSDLALAKQIVKFCAVVDPKVVIVKVAKDDGGGLPAALDGVTELPLVQAYLERKAPAGVKVSAYSLSADLLRANLKIYFDPLLPVATIKAAVEAAIVRFNTLLPFNGMYNLNKLVDAIQAVPGVIDIDVDSVEYKIGSNPYVAIDQEYQTEAGYVQIDSASGNTLNDTVQYIPYAV